MWTLPEDAVDEGPQRQHRRLATRVMHAALEAVDPARAIQRVVQRRGNTLVISERIYDLTRYHRVLVVGMGKAGATMGLALADILGDHLSAGIISTKYGHASPHSHPRLTILEAGHPVPDENSVLNAQRIAGLVGSAEPNDLVICLISGGGSALAVSPAPGLSLADKQAVTSHLLSCGATINEINCVRKHLSLLKGGGIARLASQAHLVSLILSDVVGNPLDVIASGPTVPDPTTFADAHAVLTRYGLLDRVPAPIRQRILDGVNGRVPETPKPGDPIFDRVQNVIIGSNEHAARAALRAAGELGFHTLLLSTYVEGEAREVGRVMAAILREVVTSGSPIPRPACIIAGGETTVTITGSGLGGRNQELALAAAIQMDGLEDVLLGALGTDGTDGPTDAAGAVADGSTIQRARRLGLDPLAFLATNDSYHFFQRIGDLIITGPTGTNVNDLIFLFAF